MERYPHDFEHCKCGTTNKLLAQEPVVINVSKAKRFPATKGIQAQRPAALPPDQRKGYALPPAIICFEATPPLPPAWHIQIIIPLASMQILTSHQGSPPVAYHLQLGTRWLYQCEHMRIKYAKPNLLSSIYFDLLKNHAANFRMRSPDRILNYSWIPPGPPLPRRNPRNCPPSHNP